MTDDLARLKERLTARYSHRGDGIPTQPVNPDGEEAVKAIERLEEELENHLSVSAAIAYASGRETGLEDAAAAIRKLKDQ